MRTAPPLLLDLETDESSTSTCISKAARRPWSITFGLSDGDTYTALRPEELLAELV